ncbi:MAG TPA: CehA/McbA family metallohydrolase [Chloroflexota bacterium]|jgi:hypothetical protein
MSGVLRHVLSVTQADSRTYVPIPFEVPPGTARIEVTYTVHSTHPERCATDIGLRDPVDWRGWTGSHRKSIFVTPSHATPGYRLGPLTPGDWEVVLGLYDLPETGCAIEVTITLESAVAEWLTGDLHTHTVHSDGRLTVQELCAYALEQGLAFLAITDHNTITQHLEGSRDLPLLRVPGVELTTYSGHANLFGTHPVVLDFRRDRDEELADLFATAREGGLFVSVNHPSETDCGWEHTFDLPYDGLEIWNSAWNDRNAASLNLWQRLLVEGRRLIALGGSDFHGPAVHDEPVPVVTRIFVHERGVDALLAGLRAGHVIVAGGVGAPELEFTLAGAMIGDTVSAPVGTAPLSLRILGDASCRALLVSERGIEHEYRVDRPAWTLNQDVPTDRRFYRVEVWSVAERSRPLVITNPIFLER